MNELGKVLVEVEAVLERLQDENKQKIPQKVWDFIRNNKDNSYIFKYDDTKPLEEQKLRLDTCSMLMYLNREYLLNEEEKKKLDIVLRENEQLEEEEKRKKYNPDDIFKNNKS